MKKINIVLNETSIINFPFLWKLIKRYRFLSLSVPLIAAVYSFYTYMGQNTIYSGRVGFKYVSETSNSPTSMIFSVIGEKTSKLDPTEIISYGNSVDFQYKVADEIISNGNYKKMNFNSITSKKLKNFEDIFASCAGNRDCERDRVARLVGQFYSVSMSNDVIDRYHLVVRSLDHNTTDTLVKIVSDTIKRDRLNNVKYFISSQIKITNDLMKEKKEEFGVDKVRELLDKQAQLAIDVKTAKDKMNNIRNHYFTVKNNLNRSEVELRHTKEVMSKTSKASNMELLKVAESKKIRERIRQLREDISSIETSFEGAGLGDSQIVSKLKTELRVNERKLASIGDVNKSSDSDSEMMVDRRGDQEKRYRVYKKQFAKTDNEYKTLKKELDDLIAQKTEVDVQVKTHEPNLELLRLLEQKLIQLKVAESTIVADLVFDNYQSEVASFKKIDKAKMIFVSVFFSCFLLLFVVILRYIFDGRIYDEYELRNNFEDLEIIGNTPDFH